MPLSATVAVSFFHWLIICKYLEKLEIDFINATFATNEECYQRWHLLVN